jgi:hypothetical protein
MMRRKIGFDNAERSGLYVFEAEGHITTINTSPGWHNHIVELEDGMVLVVSSVYENNTRCSTVYQGIRYERTYYRHCPLTLSGINEIARGFIAEIKHARS